MSVFVHLTPEKNLKSLLRNGIKPRRSGGYKPLGVYALPVLQNYFISHQWLRELRRSSLQNGFYGVYFRLPDDEKVLIGHYGRNHFEMSAVEAVAIILDKQSSEPSIANNFDKNSKAVSKGKKLPASPLGYEVIIPRSIKRKEIIKVKYLNQVLGWRYNPYAHGNPPCACLCCESGAYGIGKLRRRVEEDEKKGRKPKITLFGRFD